MKRPEKYLLLLLLPLMACSTSKMSNVNLNEDNVYVSKAKAKEYEPWVRPEPTETSSRNETEEINSISRAGNIRDYDFDRYDDSDYFSYSSRIYRFNYYSPWRNYYDPWFDPFYYNSRFYYYDRFYYRTMPSWSFNLNFGSPWYDPWYAYNPYWRYRYGDIYSYYNTVPYPYYGGYYGGGAFYPSNPRYNRPRPGRNIENIAPGNSYPNGDSGSRADRYQGNGINRPTTSGARPSRVQDNAPAPRRESGSSGQNRPSRSERYTPPPSSNNNNSSSSSRGNDSNDSKPRPARTGGR
jgi:hypothetical protein